jgi:hypothetical protein
MTQALAPTALVYDFDGTLARGNIQEHTFIPNLGIAIADFWGEVKRLAREHDADEVLIYMWYMLQEARLRDIVITREAFLEHGRKTPLFEGLDTWFDRINQHGAERGLEIQHFIISSGTHEMIEGSPISSRFQRIYASKFVYDGTGEAVWPGLAINYTNKTQFLFRINKGIENSWDNERINRYIPEPERPIPFARMVFLGDGDTDIPSMKMVSHQGGHAVAVFDPEKWSSARTQQHVYRLIAEDRAHFTVPADYREGSQLDVTIKGVLGRIARAEGYRGEREV